MVTEGRSSHLLTLDLEFLYAEVKMQVPATKYKEKTYCRARADVFLNFFYSHKAALVNLRCITFVTVNLNGDCNFFHCCFASAALDFTLRSELCISRDQPRVVYLRFPYYKDNVQF